MGAVVETFVTFHPLEADVENPVETGEVIPAASLENVVFLAEWKKRREKADNIAVTKPSLIYGVGSTEEWQAVSGIGSEKDRETVQSIVDTAYAQVIADDAARDARMKQKTIVSADHSANGSY